MRTRPSPASIPVPFRPNGGESLTKSAPQAAPAFRRLNAVSSASERLIGLLTALLFAFLLWAAPVAAQGPSDGAPKVATGALRPTRLNAVASSRIFATVNVDDATAALKAALDLIAREKGFLLDSKVDIVNNEVEIRKRLESGSVDLLILDALDYLRLETSKLIVPALVGTRSDTGGSQYSYLLMVNQSFGAGTVADLRGKKLNHYSRNETSAGLAWIEVMLGNQGLGRVSSFFESVKAKNKPQDCILPLFFGTVDACVVDEVNLNLQKELNPQLAKLRVLSRSTPLIDRVVATPTEDHPYKEELIDSMLTLHQTPRGKQILMVFKAGRLVPFAPDDMDSTRELWKEYSRLTDTPVTSNPKAPSPSLTEAPATAASLPKIREQH